MIEILLPLDVQAPGAARTIVEHYLRDRPEAPAIDTAQLLVSELVTNSLRHSGARPDDQVRLTIRAMPGRVWIAVQDPGLGADIMAAAADPTRSNGFGLQLVETLSEHWGVERLARGGTQVWAQVLCVAGGAAGMNSSGTATAV
jgi:anti-sigma regulatory factor (Ser/Thr protein kinase)